MTLEELAGMLEKTGIPFAYDHFAEGESPDPPFICYLLPGSDNFAAENAIIWACQGDWFGTDHSGR